LVPPQPTLCAAGSTIVLDTVEGARLTQLGFLVDPSKETVELGDSGVSQTVTVATP
jgi:hypothetical protein